MSVRIRPEGSPGVQNAFCNTAPGSAQPESCVSVDNATGLWSLRLDLACRAVVHVLYAQHRAEGWERRSLEKRMLAFVKAGENNFCLHYITVV